MTREKWSDWVLFSVKDYLKIYSAPVKPDRGKITPIPDKYRRLNWLINHGNERALFDFADVARRCGANPYDLSPDEMEEMEIKYQVIRL